MRQLVFSLPTQIYKIYNDKSKIQQEIYHAIENLHGINVGLYPPLMAFEAIVRMLISQLEEPIVLCVDIVIEELSNAVRSCTQRVSNGLERNLIAETESN